jgi:hypothetical protein
LTTPTDRGAILFSDGVPDLEQWEIEFRPQCCGFRSDPYPARVTQIGRLIEIDPEITPRSKDIGRRLLRYYSSYGLANHTGFFRMNIFLTVLTVPLILIGWWWYWFAFVTGIVLGVYAGWGFCKRSNQRKQAEAEMAELQALLAQARTERGPQIEV